MIHIATRNCEGLRKATKKRKNEEQRKPGAFDFYCKENCLFLLRAWSGGYFCSIDSSRNHFLRWLIILFAAWRPLSSISLLVMVLKGKARQSLQTRLQLFSSNHRFSHQKTFCLIELFRFFPRSWHKTFFSSHCLSQRFSPSHKNRKTSNEIIST